MSNVTDAMKGGAGSDAMKAIGGVADQAALGVDWGAGIGGGVDIVGGYASAFGNDKGKPDWSLIGKGASLGTMIMPGVGTAVGAIAGLIPAAIQAKKYNEEQARIQREERMRLEESFQRRGYDAYMERYNRARNAARFQQIVQFANTGRY